MLFKSKNPQFEFLHKKWLNKHKVITQNLVDKHLRHVALGSLGGLLLLPTPGLMLAAPVMLPSPIDAHVVSLPDENKLLANQLQTKVPSEVRPLNSDEESQVTTILNQQTGLNVSSELDGIRLNTDYGLIGGEQHLYRYPGDNVLQHAKDARDWAMFGGAGIAPGLGAWGYFASSKAEFTPQDEAREKWYIAVQTFLAPGYAENTAKYRDFFKYRKMLVVNPSTGQAVVTDIADSGPSEYTGKQLGGSPEVMEVLGLGSGPRKGAVLYFFINDPNDQVPLGPLTLPENQS